MSQKETEAAKWCLLSNEPNNENTDGNEPQVPLSLRLPSWSFITHLSTELTWERDEGYVSNPEEMLHGKTGK